MTAGSADKPAGTPPQRPGRLLVLGLGNLLLADDACGLRLLERLSAEPLPHAEYIDGGTQGLALMGFFENRDAVLILDAVGLGATPGTVHVLHDADIAQLRAARANSAHESNALGLLQALTLIGQAPPRLCVVGIEPAVLKTEIGLSPEVEAALPLALDYARAVLSVL